MRHPVASNLVYQGGRARALELGYAFYNTGKPCKNEHFSYRRTGDGQCYACARDTQKARSQRYASRHPDRTRMNCARQRSEAAGVPFDKGAYSRAWESRPTHCPILGLELLIGRAPRPRPDNTPEMDRLVPELGYVSGNIQIVSARANWVKNNGTAEEHRKIADWMEKELAK